MSFARRLHLPLLAFLPLLLACGSPPFPLQETALTGPPAELRSFEGSWYSEAGDLMAVIEAGRHPRFAVRLYSPYLHLDEARVEKGSIRFAAQGEQEGWTVFGSAQLVAPDRLSLQQLSAQGEPIEVFICGNEIVVPRGALLRGPSSWWLAKKEPSPTNSLIAQSGPESRAAGGRSPKPTVPVLQLRRTSYYGRRVAAQPVAIETALAQQGEKR